MTKTEKRTFQKKNVLMQTHIKAGKNTKTARTNTHHQTQKNTNKFTTTQSITNRYTKSQNLSQHTPINEKIKHQLQQKQLPHTHLHRHKPVSKHN